MNESENPAGQGFGALLRHHRRAAGLTQAELAESAGLSVRALSNLERGRSRAAQRRSTELLADALGLTGSARESFLGAARDARRRGAEPRPAVLSSPPPAVADLVGRMGELRWLSEAAEDALRTPGGIVVSVAGQAGVGKTALVQTAADALRGRFRDGFLSVDLRGMDDQPVSPRAALDILLRALGVPPARIPKTVAEQTAVYHSAVAGRRLLVVLDNASDTEQIRPLLPGERGCLTLVTGRRVLTGLDGARALRLGPLAATDAAALVRSIVGAERVAAEPGPTAELVELCGNLPLAVRIAGNRLASRPDWSLAHLVAQLRDERTRLAALSAGDLRVRPAFEISHRRLSPAARRVFRHAAIVPGPDFGPELAGVATGLPAESVLEPLGELVDASLLQALGDGRYTYHQLIRLYAREQLGHDEDETGEPLVRAERRVHDHLLTTAVGAGALFHPDARGRGARFATREEAGAWLDAESGNWLAAQRAAARAGRHREVLTLARALHWYSDSRVQQVPWDEVNRLAVAAARALGDRSQEATALNALGWSRYFCLGDDEGGLQVLREALTVAEAAGEDREQAWALAYLGAVLMRLGRPNEALAHVRRSVAMSGELAFWLGQCTIRNALGQILTAVGRPDEGLAVHRAVLVDAEFYRDEANPDTYRLLRSFTMQLIGHAQEALADWPLAAETYGIARASFAAAGLAFPAADAALHEGMAWRQAGRPDAALGRLRAALPEFTGPLARWERAQTHAELALLLRHEKEAEADEHRREALALCEELGTRRARELAARLTGPVAAGPSSPGGGHATGARPFTGRAEELAYLRAARRAAEPPFTVLWLHGPGGIGKTTLVRRFAEDAIADGERCVVLDARTFGATPRGFRAALGSAEWPAGVRLLVLDTAELVTPLEKWLREEFLPTAPPRAVLVVAGRDKPGAEWIADSTTWKALRVIEVRDLAPAEAAEFLRRRAVPAREIPGVLRFTHGHPLALALVADVVAHRTGAARPWEVRESPDVVRQVLRHLLREVPSEQHREALEVFALARVTTAALLRQSLSGDSPDAGALFTWLRGLSFAQTTADGLVPHATAREALVADLRRRDPERYECLYRRVYRHVSTRMLEQSGSGGHAAVLDFLYLSRYGAVREFFPWEAVPDTRVEPARPADEEAVLRLVERHEGAGAARLARRWWQAQPEAFTVFRRRAGAVDGLVVLPRIPAGGSPVPGDPIATAALDWAAANAPLRAGEHLLLGRWMMGADHYQDIGGAGTLQIATTVLLSWTSAPHAALSYTCLAEGEAWASVFAFAGHERLPRVTDLGGRAPVPFVFDWRVTSPADWVAQLEDRQLTTQS